MLSDATRNWIVQLEIEALRTGKMPKGLSPEEQEFFDDGYEGLKELRDEIGPEEFSKITIDVGYNY